MPSAWHAAKLAHPAPQEHAPDVDLDRLKIERTPAAPRRRRRRAGWTGIVLLAGAAAVLWALRAPIAARIDRWRLPVVELVRVAPASALARGSTVGTAANGYVVARHRAALSADTPGRIVEMDVEEGSVVRAGQVVARLYAAEYEAALRRSEADLASAQAQIARLEAERDATRTRLAELGARVDGAGSRLAEARASLELARRTHERSEALLGSGVAPAERVDETRAGLESARAQVAAGEASVVEARSAVASGESQLAVAEAAVEEGRSRVAVLEAERDRSAATLAKTAVRAPFDGIVVLKDAEVGEVVSPNAQGAQSRGSVVTMVDFESLEVQVEVPETSLAAVSPGAQAEIYLDAFPDHRYTGRVDRIWPTANRQKATVEVRVTFDETDERLRPEMGVRVVFVPEGGEVAAAADEEVPRGVLLPASALVRIDGRAGAFVLERDVARFRALEIGAESAGRVLVLSGLEAGERVVASPPLSLADGDRVRLEK